MTDEIILPAHGVAAGGIVRSGKGEILLVKNERRGWEFPGGLIEEGENVIDGLIREIREESGIEAQVRELFCISSDICSYPGYNGVKTVPPKVIFDFICEYRSGEPIPTDESLETRFVPENDVLSMMTRPVMIERFRAYLNYTGRPIYMSYESRPEFIKHLQCII